jgi:hypothetical protein
MHLERIVPDVSLDRCTLLLSVDHYTKFYSRMPTRIQIFRKSIVMFASIELVSQYISASTISLLRRSLPAVILLSMRFTMLYSQATPFCLQCQQVRFSDRSSSLHTNQPLTVVTIKSSLAILSSKQPSLML